mmetsp:Transcript_98255/g.300433  ORF Transcript_98255/g.300433 Transcript_98255/m.300433 type:complete len:229 (-) Transcript_98255:298-984(-)
MLAARGSASLADVEDGIELRRIQQEKEVFLQRGVPTEFRLRYAAVVVRIVHAHVILDEIFCRPQLVEELGLVPVALKLPEWPDGLLSVLGPHCPEPHHEAHRHLHLRAAEHAVAVDVEGPPAGLPQRGGVVGRRGREHQRLARQELALGDHTIAVCVDQPAEHGHELGRGRGGRGGPLAQRATQLAARPAVRRPRLDAAVGAHGCSEGRPAGVLERLGVEVARGAKET